SAEHQQEGGRQALEYQIQHWHVISIGVAEVELQHSLQVQAQLRQQRLVQAEFGAQGGEVGGIVRARLAGQRGRRLARGQPYHEGVQYYHVQHDREGLAQARYEKGQEFHAKHLRRNTAGRRTAGCGGPPGRKPAADRARQARLLLLLDIDVGERFVQPDGGLDQVLDVAAVQRGEFHINQESIGNVVDQDGLDLGIQLLPFGGIDFRGGGGPELVGL